MQDANGQQLSFAKDVRARCRVSGRYTVAVHCLGLQSYGAGALLQFVTY